jgi:hypothetical protein
MKGQYFIVLPKSKCYVKMNEFLCGFVTNTSKFEAFGEQKLTYSLAVFLVLIKWINQIQCTYTGESFLEAKCILAYSAFCSLHHSTMRNILHKHKTRKIHNPYL